MICATITHSLPFVSSVCVCVCVRVRVCVCVCVRLRAWWEITPPPRKQTSSSKSRRLERNGTNFKANPMHYLSFSPQYPIEQTAMGGGKERKRERKRERGRRRREKERGKLCQDSWQPNQSICPGGCVSALIKQDMVTHTHVSSRWTSRDSQGWPVPDGLADRQEPDGAAERGDTRPRANS